MYPISSWGSLKFHAVRAVVMYSQSPVYTVCVWHIHKVSNFAFKDTSCVFVLISAADSLALKSGQLTCCQLLERADFLLQSVVKKTQANNQHDETINKITVHHLTKETVKASCITWPELTQIQKSFYQETDEKLQAWI